MKKAVCVILTICMVFCLAGCASIDEMSSSSDEIEMPSSEMMTGVISLLYSYSDTFDPYTAKTNANRQLSSLLYDPLVKTNNSFEAQGVLAESINNEGTTWTVKLKTATFTDGSSVTTDDVIYSYNVAKNNPAYAYNFYEVTSVSALDSKTVVFNLSQHDEYFANLLDFPIVKSGTSAVTDADGKEVPPVGCGRYYLAEDKLSLKLNTNYYGKIGNIKEIKLINSPDAASTSHYVEVGATQLYYNDDGDIVRMSGKKTEVNLNRFVYMGINDSYGSLQTKEMRYAISAALDRQVICQSAYYNNAVAAEGFFNPYFEATNALQTIESKPNFKITVENLAKTGYNNMNSSGYYANASGNNPVFTLLVNSENSSRVAAAKLIAEQCKIAGIQIKVIECTYAQYIERLSTGDFQLYLGEVQVRDNMDFSELVIPGGIAAYGVGLKKEENESSQDGEATAETQPIQKNSCEGILATYHSGQCGLNDVAGVLLTEMPQIPVCYLNGVLFYDSAISGGVYASSSDIYLSIENYEF